MIDLDKVPATYKEFIDGLSKDGEPIRGQLYLVTSKDCPPCDDAETHFKEDLDNGTIKRLTEEDEKGLEMIKALQLEETPALVLEKEDGSLCKIGDDGLLEACQMPIEEMPELSYNGQLYLIVAEDCPNCESTKEILADEIENGTIITASIDDDKGWDIIKTLKISSTPSLILERRDGSYERIENEEQLIDDPV